MTNNSTWVACWGNATSITNRSEAIYAKDLTLRYPIRMCFSGSMLRFRFSNLTGTEPVTLDKVLVGHTPITFGGEKSVTLMPGTETESDAISYAVSRGDTIEVSMYLAGYTQMNSGTLITGPLSKGFYAYGDYAEADELPLNLSRRTNWFYFLNTIDVLTSAENHAIVCYGDSITAQSWPDYMALQAFGSNVSIIRRAVSGTRILRQYDCITYQAYGLKGATRFPIEMNVAGATDVIIQHGTNDIIHPGQPLPSVERPAHSRGNGAWCRRYLREARQSDGTKGVEWHIATHLWLAYLQRRPRDDASAVQRMATHIAHL